jgi:hypothetical protein
MTVIRRLLVAAGITALGAAACGSESSSEGSGSVTICGDIEARLNQLNETLQCPSGGEVLGDMCRRGLASKPACRREVQALYDCAKDRPLSEWSCHAIGEYPALSGACLAEDRAIGTCFNG